jgi:flagellar hook-basal body complex protein FliE
MAIDPPSLRGLSRPQFPIEPNAEVGPNSFVDLLGKGLEHVHQSQVQADNATFELLTGGNITSAEVFTSVQKADIAFQTLIQIRNKLVQAYQELAAMQI